MFESVTYINNGLLYTPAFYSLLIHIYVTLNISI